MHTIAVENIYKGTCKKLSCGANKVKTTGNFAHCHLPQMFYKYF